jgi:hypothetical protein
MFTQRHYKAIADTLREQASRHDLFNRAELSETIDALARMFERDNPQFKPHMFRAAIWRDGGE